MFKCMVGILFLLLPVLVLSLMYYEGGLLGVILYFGYALGALVLFKLPIIGIKMIKGV